MHIWRHFKTISRHRREVRRLCFKIGLYRQGLVHDLSKYSPAEFIPGCRYYQGFRSPNDLEREMNGYSSAWLHHKGKNRHHFEYWTDYPQKGKRRDGERFQAVEMPLRYVAEMFCDRVAACKVYRGKDYSQSDPLEYQEKIRAHAFMHENTEKLISDMLAKLSAEGEDAACAYIRELLRAERRCRR